MKQTKLPNIKTIYCFESNPTHYRHWYLLIDENNQIHTFNNTFGVFNWRGNLEIGMSSVSKETDTAELLEKYNWIKNQIETQNSNKVFDEYTGSTYQDLIDCNWFIDPVNETKYIPLTKGKKVPGYDKLWESETITKKLNFKK